jgi:ATP:ADP antiporter, AAA family
MGLPGSLRFSAPRGGELVRAGLAFLCFFSLLAGSYVLRPIRDALGVEGGVKNYAYLFTGTFVGTLVVYPALGALASRTTRTRFAIGVFSAVAAGLVVFRMLLVSDLPERYLAWAFFVWVSVTNVVLTSVFWGVMADVFSNEEGRRQFGFIAAGGTAGAMAGPFLTRVLVGVVGVEGMLLLAAGIIAVALLCVIALSRRRTDRDEPARPHDPIIGGTTLDGLNRVARSPYLRGISTYILLLTATATFAYFQQGWIVEREIAERTERTQFFADLDLVTNALTLAVQIFLTRFLARRFGVTALLIILPLATGLGFAVLALAPVLVAFAIFQVIRRTSDYGLARPGREVLFTLVNREDKFKAKNVVDVVVYRGGDAAVAWLNIALTAAGLGVGATALCALPLCALWLVNARALGRSEARRRAEPSEDKT